MLILTDSAAGYPWPVSFTRPHADDAGKREPVAFVAQFRFLSQSRLDALAESLRPAPDSAGRVAPALTDAGLIEEVLIGWDGVRDAAGAALPFTPATLAAALDVPGVRTALVRAWFASLAEGERGN